MASREQFMERLRLAVRDSLRQVLAEGDLPIGEEGEALFTTIETLALTAGDAVSLEVFEQQLSECGIGIPHCPHCGFEGRHIRDRDRDIQSRRGLDVPLRETEWYCTGCRRSFFPSVPTLGTGRELGLQSKCPTEGHIRGNSGE